MGGQAYVLYGAAEFSRDLDLALLPDPANLESLRVGGTKVAYCRLRRRGIAPVNRIDASRTNEQ